jgi:hypothetical protein
MQSHCKIALNSLQRGVLISLAALLFATTMFGGATAAYATQYELYNANGFVPDGPTYATVNTSINGNTITITVSASPGFAIFGNGSGNGAFGFNVVDPDAGVALSNFSSGFSNGGTGGQFDGFGKFEFNVDGPTGSGALSSLSFDVTRSPNPFTDVSQVDENNPKGFNFVAHIANLTCQRETPNGNCTGYVSTGTETTQSVPEPSVLILLGLGFVLSRKFLKKHETNGREQRLQQ